MGRSGFFTDDSANESGQVELYLEWISLVTGGIPATFARSAGFGLVSPATAAVVRTGAGLFTVQFDAPWALPYLDFAYNIKQAAYAAAGACVVQVLTDNLMATTGVMTIEVTNAAGAAVDPTTGDNIRLHFTMQSHTAGY
jgi:hypothetical protein